MSPRVALPRCEACRKEPASSFSWFADRARWYAPQSGTWRFTGACTADSETYYVKLHNRGHGFLDSPAARENWLRHLQEKVWFDRAEFCAMLARFAAAARQRPTKRGRPAAAVRRADAWRRSA
jgi:hypothetical protein